MAESISLRQNIPTRAWEGRLVATNVRGREATVVVELPGELAVDHQVGVGDEVAMGERTLRVEEITGGGHDGPPGRASGLVTLAVVGEPA